MGKRLGWEVVQVHCGGLVMLAVLALGTAFSGLPVWVLLVGVSSAAALAGVASGVMDMQVLGAMPVRVIGLLESDILQALPLYVFVGLLLQRLAVAQALFAVLTRLFARCVGSAAAGRALAALGLGALIAPMNGSVASSASMLTLLLRPQLQGLDAARSTAWVSVASTIGVVVPPSLVLILLGDAMMRAHTEALNLPGILLQSAHIINTQDVFHAALLPALALVLSWAAVVRRQSGSDASVVPATSKAEVVLAMCAVVFIMGLLWAVFAGRVFAVEAAASACMLLVAGAILTRALSLQLWRELLVQSMAMSGALLALLVGATVFSLVFRLWGTDLWLVQTMLSSPLPHAATAALVLLGVGLCGWVLDAFELIFVIIPIVGPALIGLLGDAQQVSVLLLLALQLSFLLPPMGYAVMLARGSMAPSLSNAALLKAMLPFLLALVAVIAVVFCVPAAVHQLDAPAVLNAPGDAAESDTDLVRRMQEMTQPAESSQPESPKP
jgi:TRAP-type mannitol/chloroaromatic compound transport system permease large subunit